MTARVEPPADLDAVLSELLRLSVEWREAALSEIEVARKAHAITRLWGRHGVEIAPRRTRRAARAGGGCVGGVGIREVLKGQFPEAKTLAST